MSKFFRSKINSDTTLKRSRVLSFLQNKLFHFNVILAILVVGFGLLYLLSINQSSTKGFTVKGLENRIAELKDQNRVLELQATELQALSNIQAAAATNNMVASTRVEFAPAVGSIFAVR